MATLEEETKEIAHSLLVLILLVVLAILVLDLLYILPIRAPIGGAIIGGGLLWAIIVNTVIGLIIILVLNAIFHLGIRYTIWVFLFVAIFGLLGVAIIIILRLLGVRW